MADFKEGRFRRGKSVVSQKLFQKSFTVFWPSLAAGEAEKQSICNFKWYSKFFL
jgi:hypothetical protein